MTLPTPTAEHNAEPFPVPRRPLPEDLQATDTIRGLAEALHREYLRACDFVDNEGYSLEDDFDRLPDGERAGWFAVARAASNLTAERGEGGDA